MDTVTESRSQGIYPHFCARIISFCCIFADSIALAATTVENTDENGGFRPVYTSNFLVAPKCCAPIVIAYLNLM